MSLQIKQALQRESFLCMYFCHYHLAGIFDANAVECDCRKPGSKLFNDAIRDYLVNLQKSFIFGDKLTDCLAAYRANIAYRVLLSENGSSIYESRTDCPQYLVSNKFKDLSEVVNFL